MILYYLVGLCFSFYVNLLVFCLVEPLLRFYIFKPLRRINAIVASCWNYFTILVLLFNTVISDLDLEFGRPRCVWNNEVKYNEGQNTTEFIS